MTLHNQIHKFTAYFREQLKIVANLTANVPIGDTGFHSDVVTHRKILYCAILDCLAAVRYHGNNLGNRERFLRLLTDHSNWPEDELVSVPVLRQRLAHSPTSSLTAHLDAKLALRDPNAPNGTPLSTFDEPVSDLLPLSANGGDEYQLICNTRHSELVYRCRNFLVHEFREPGYGMESFADGGVDPLYHAYINDPTWRLVYPVGFFHRLADSAVTSLEEWFLSSFINPYDAVRDSSDWYSG